MQKANFNTGFIHDLPDKRDFKLEKDNLMKLGETLPDKVDLSSRFTPIEDQEQLGSCTAQAVVGLCEYLTNISKSTYIDLSRLFLYKITRNIMQVSGDTGASLRSCMHAAKLIGICPEKYYPYNIDNFDEEPAAFYYAMAQSYKIGMDYYRLTEDDTLVPTIKELLADSQPVVCGVKVYEDYFKNSGNVYYPTDGIATLSGWHAIVLVGYDEAKQMFKFRNSWGKDWGKDGYGWISYDYFTNDASSDHWTAYSMNFVDISEI